jgi:ubiquinol-cytochrome c reductase cytochrome c subunit
MKSSSRILGLSLVVVGFLAAGHASESAAAPASSTAAPALLGDAVAGKEKFAEHCSICHGADAKGFIGPSIGGITWGTAGLHTIVRFGLGGYGSMPAFNEDAVTDQDIANIAAYLAALGPKPAATSPAVAASPAAAVTSGGDPIHGRQIYMTNCAACHGATGDGGVGPNLHGEKSRKDTAAAIAWIKHPKLPMPTLYPDPLSANDVEDVAAYIESL